MEVPGFRCSSKGLDSLFTFPYHSKEEDRYITIGKSLAGRLLIVAHTDRGDRIRIISSRELTSSERKAYENEIRRRKG